MGMGSSVRQAIGGKGGSRGTADVGNLYAPPSTNPSPNPNRPVLTAPQGSNFAGNFAANRPQQPYISPFNTYRNFMEQMNGLPQQPVQQTPDQAWSDYARNQQYGSGTEMDQARQQFMQNYQNAPVPLPTPNLQPQQPQFMGGKGGGYGGGFNPGGDYGANTPTPLNFLGGKGGGRVNPYAVNYGAGSNPYASGLSGLMQLRNAMFNEGGEVK